MFTITSSKKRFLTFFIIGWIMLLVSDRVSTLRIYQGSYVATYTLAVASIILLTGYSGQLSLGHGAIMAVGAYAGAIAIGKALLNPVLGLIAAALVAGFFGLILGFAVARLSGPYLAGTTLALAVALPTLANQFELLGGQQGLPFDVGSSPERFGEEFSQYKWYFWICALAALIMIWWIANLVSGRHGRTYRALRDNPIAAELSGINVGRQKVIVFAISSAAAGLSGGLLVILLGGVSPSAFPLGVSFFVLTGAIITGLYNLKGVILGGLILVALPEIADSLVSRIGESEGLTNSLPDFLVSALLILSVVFAPNGPGQILKRRHSK
jgi:branched-chain amino acid transport system permease protein